MFFKTKIKGNKSRHQSTDLTPYFALARKSAQISKLEIEKLRTQFTKVKNINIDLSKGTNFLRSHKLSFRNGTNRKKIAAATAAIVTFGITSGVVCTNFTFAYTVVASDNVIGVCATKEDAESALENAQKNLSDINGSDVEELSEAKIGLTIAKKESVQSERAMEEAIVDVYDIREDCYGVMFNGRMLAATRTREDAEAALSSYKQEFSSENIAEITFNGEVSVEEAKEKSTNIKASAEEVLAELKAPSGNVKIHKISEGETISAVAVMYGMSTNDVMNNNPGIKPETLQIGQEITVSDSSPVLKVVTVEYVKETEEIPFETVTTYDAESYKGTETVLVEGVKGSKEVDYRIVKENGTETEKTAENENITVQPVTREVRVGTKEKPKTAATGTFVCPYRGTVTSNYGARWGRNHNGVDLAGPTGAAVISADGGTVIKAGYYNSFGNLIVIDHGNGYQTYYAHLSAINVRAGQKVAQSQLIGKVGNTGNSTGPHLHFEVRVQGSPVNPRPYINY